MSTREIIRRVNRIHRPAPLLVPPAPFRWIQLEVPVKNEAKAIAAMVRGGDGSRW